MMRKSVFGFLLVTVDPHLRRGGKGHARDLVDARLQARAWPLFSRTPGRAMLEREGTQLCFYVAGTGPSGGRVIARAEVMAVRRDATDVDPPEFVTPAAATVLELADVVRAAHPVSFRDVVQRMSFSPDSIDHWGAVLQGGVRGLTDQDWRLLFPRTSPTAR